MSFGLFLHLAVLAFLASCASSVRLHGRNLNAELLPSYDYIVVGGGISGLVIGNRLSEDPKVMVLVIEAGIADHYEEFIQVPQFVGSDVGSQYDWNLSTVPQSFLDGAPRPYPQGKALGGGSILNAMCWNRGGQDTFDAWEDFGNPGWGWDGLLPYFKKSETYTPVDSPEIAAQFSISYNPDVHGTEGPVQVSYPKYFYNQSANFFAALNQLGLGTEMDPNDGTSSGAAFLPTDLDPENQTRSDARRTYYDPYQSRPNFHVLTGHQVTRINIAGIAGNGASGVPSDTGSLNGDGASGGLGGSGLFGNGSSAPPPTSGDGMGDPPLLIRDLPDGLRITGVEFASNSAAPRQNVSTTREVIVAAGSLHSAQLLQLSGIGPSSLLKTYDIPIAVDLPGVGNNLQDHYLVGTFYPYNNVSASPAELTQNATFDSECRDEYYSKKTGPWTAGSPNGLAFPSLPSTSNISTSILQAADDQEPDEYLVTGLDSSVVAGYAAQKNSLVRSLLDTNVAAWEIINNNIGSLTVAVMHPFSRGTCYIDSPNPFVPPLIDPRYGSNPVDLRILVEALKFNRRILATDAMVELQPAQFVPPADADEDELMEVVKNGIRTEYHPSGTCAMLPKDQGGVVDSHLRVYGTQNLRVVDASIFPLVPAAHLQAVVYGVAEKAADIIKDDNLDVSAGSASLSSSTSSTQTASTESSSSGRSTRPSASRRVSTYAGQSSSSSSTTIGESSSADASVLSAESFSSSSSMVSTGSASSTGKVDGEVTSTAASGFSSLDAEETQSLKDKLTSASSLASALSLPALQTQTQTVPSAVALSLSSAISSVISEMTSSLPRSATRAALSSAETGLSLIQPTPSGSVTASSGGPTSAAPTGLDAAQQKQQQDAIATFIAWLRQLLASFTS